MATTTKKKRKLSQKQLDTLARGRKKAAKNRKSSTSASKKIKSSGGKPMATKKKKRRSWGGGGGTKATTKRRKVPKKTAGHVVSEVLTMLGGGILASLIGNKLPIKNTKAKPLVPLALGAGTVAYGLKKNKSPAIYLGAGMLTLGAIATVRANFPSVPLLAGENEEILGLMGDMEVVDGDDLEGEAYDAPQLEFSGEEEYEGDVVPLADDLDGEEYDLADDFEGDDFEGDEYDLSGSYFPTPATIS